MASFQSTFVVATIIMNCCGGEVHAQHRPSLKPAAPARHVKNVEPTLTEDASHMKEHLQDIVDVDTSKMTPEELNFHYFKIHDFDGNNMLDGLEILRAITHHIEPETIESGAIDITPYENVVDRVLKDDDLNNDGYLSYEEYTHHNDRRKSEKNSEVDK